MTMSKLLKSLENKVNDASKIQKCSKLVFSKTQRIVTGYKYYMTFFML